MKLWLVLTALVLLAAGLAPADGQVSLEGAGATFPYPLYLKWFASFSHRYPEFSIGYRAVGSGSGIEALRDPAVDFAACDVPLNDAELAALPRRVSMVPTVLGGVVPVYHLDGVLEDLRFTPAILTGIYSGRITRWNDPLLRAANRGASLPARSITVVHRSDRSGTTYAWTSYLAKVSPDWAKTTGAGISVDWPIGIAAEGNGGVAHTVSQTPDSIGYVEFLYALQNRLSYGLVQNRAGRFVQADLTTVPAAASDFAASMRGDFRASILDAPGANSYPIATLTYLLVPEQFTTPEKARAMNTFLHWMLTSGQRQCAALGYAALPPELAEKALQTIERH